MSRYFRFSFFLVGLFVISASLLDTGCGFVHYGFSDKGTIPDSVKTVRIQTLENRAPYVNPQLSPNLSDRLRQKINNQTKLTQTNSENAHWDISGTITDYSVSTSGITSENGRSQTSINRLTVSVSVTVTDTRSTNPPKEISVSRQFDFGASQSLQQAEAGLLDEMVRNLADEIFNRLFSDW